MKKIVLVAMVIALGMILSIPQEIVSRDNESDEYWASLLTLKQVVEMLNRFDDNGHNIKDIAREINADPKDVFVVWYHSYRKEELTEELAEEFILSYIFDENNKIGIKLSPFTVDQITTMVSIMVKGGYYVEDMAKEINADPKDVFYFLESLHLKVKKSGIKGFYVPPPVSIDHWRENLPRSS